MLDFRRAPTESVRNVGTGLTCRSVVRRRADRRPKFLGSAARSSTVGEHRQLCDPQMGFGQPMAKIYVGPGWTWTSTESPSVPLNSHDPSTLAFPSGPARCLRSVTTFAGM